MLLFWNRSIRNLWAVFFLCFAAVFYAKPVLAGANVSPCWDYYMSSACPAIIAGTAVTCGTCATDPTKSSCLTCALANYMVIDKVRVCLEKANECGAQLSPGGGQPTPPTICDKTANPGVSCVACCQNIAKQNCSCPAGQQAIGDSEKDCKDGYYGFCYTQCSGGKYGKPFKPEAPACMSQGAGP
jgi:hypothetical protein